MANSGKFQTGFPSASSSSISGWWADESPSNETGKSSHAKRGQPRRLFPATRMKSCNSWEADKPGNAGARAVDVRSDVAEKMPELFALGAEIAAGKTRMSWLAGHAFDNLNAALFELFYFFRIIGKKPDAAGAELTQNGR